MSDPDPKPAAPDATALVRSAAVEFLSGYAGDSAQLPYTAKVDLTATGFVPGAGPTHWLRKNPASAPAQVFGREQKAPTSIHHQAVTYLYKALNEQCVVLPASIDQRIILFLAANGVDVVPGASGGDYIAHPLIEEAV